MTTARLIGPAAILLLASPAVVNAQEAPSAEQALTELSAKAQADAAAGLMSEGSPNDRAMAGFRSPNVTLTTQKGDTSISFAFSFDLESHEPELVQRATGGRGADYYRVSRSKLSITGSAPLDDDDLHSRLFAGDSLIDGAKIKLSYSNLSNRLGNAKGAPLYLPPAYDSCFTEQAGAWISTHKDPGVTAQEYTQGLAMESRQQGIQREIILQDRTEVEQVHPLDAFVFEQCVPAISGHRFQSTGQLIRTYTKLGDEYRALFFDDRSMLKFWGFDASVGQDKYAYLNSTEFTNAKVSKTGWEVGAYAGLINWNSTFSVRARAVYGRSWELPEETEICETFGTPEEHCLTGPDGPPEKHDTGLFSLEARHLIALSDETKIAVAPQVTYRIEDDALGVEVPVYLSPDDSGKLTGGLKFAYTSKGDEFGVGVFVGVPFSIFYN